MSTLFVDTINEKTSGNGIAIPGHVVQIQSARSTAVSSTTSTTFVATNSTVTITPKFSSSKIFIYASSPLYSNADNGHVYTTIYRDSTNLNGGTKELQLHSAGDNSRGRWTNGNMMYVDSPNTTSAVTYTVYLKQGVAGTAYYDGSGGRAGITVMEIAQ